MTKCVHENCEGTPRYYRSEMSHGTSFAWLCDEHAEYTKGADRNRFVGRGMEEVSLGDAS